jgi:membrane-associated phospholipid phosphatase
VLLRRAVGLTASLLGLLAVVLVSGYFLVGAAGIGPVRQRDLRVLSWFYLNRNPFTTSLMTAVPLLFVPVVVSFVARWRRPEPGGPNRAQLFAALASAVAGALVIEAVARTVFARPHPPDSFAALPTEGFSFPSLPVAVAVAACVAMTRVARPRNVRPALAWLGCGAACVLFAVSQVVLRECWMTDAAVGLLVGAGWGLIATALTWRFDPNREVARPAVVWARRRRHRFAALGAMALLLLVASPVELSYERALSFPGSASWQLRSVDWLRSNHGSGVVDWVEGFWYQRSPVADGGRMPHLRNPFGDRGEQARVRLAVAPPVIAAPIHPRLQHEARWAPGPIRLQGRPVLYTAQWRPDPIHTTVTVAALWVDHRLTRPQLVAGTREPTGRWPWGAEIPVELRSRVVAAFNGGFRLGDNVGGFWLGGRVGRPLVPGRASLVIRRDGSVDVVAWRSALQADRSIVAVRQNLDLVIDHGRAEPGIGRNSESRKWSNRYLQAEWTWRSGVGVDRHGNLVYVAGSKLDLAGLTRAMLQAGIVRGMELDMHPGVVTCNLYVPDANVPSGVVARKLIPSMTRPATRYLQPDQRDFIALELRDDRV